jgi:hypothetical protein
MINDTSKIFLASERTTLSENNRNPNLNNNGTVFDPASILPFKFDYSVGYPTERVMDV